MGEPVNISLGVRSNPARNRQAGSARFINCVAEETEQEGKVLWTIYGTPGLLGFGAPLGDGPIRAALPVDGTLYVVSGRSIYSVNQSGVSVRIGGLPTEGPAYMDRNRNERRRSAS